MKPAAQVFIVLFLSSQFALIVHCFLSGEKLWGWHMFSQATLYRIQILEQTRGRMIQVRPRRLATVLGQRTSAYLSPSPGLRNFHRGAGLLLAAAARLPEALCRAPGTTGSRIVVRLDYRSPLETEMHRQEFEARCDG